MVCNFEEQIKVRTEYRMKMSITRSQFVIEQFLLSKFEREVARFLTVKFRKKANSNYELNVMALPGIEPATSRVTSV